MTDKEKEKDKQIDNNTVVEEKITKIIILKMD